MVVVRPIGDGAQRGARAEACGLGEEGHEGDEAAVRSSVDADALGVDAKLLLEEAGTVDLVGQVEATHVPVDGGSPVAAVAGGSAVVHVEHDVAARREQVVEHVLAVV